MLETDIKVKTQTYDGPLGLLLYLVQKEEMDIAHLDISHITKQYLDYISRMKDLNFDIAGEYLFMAATLMYLKSRVAIFDIESSTAIEEGDGPFPITTQAELIRRLLELQKFQALGSKLWDLPKMGHEIFTRPKLSKQSLANSLHQQLDLNKLVMAHLDFMRKDKRKFALIKRDRLSIKEKLIFLKKYLSEGEKTTLQELLLKGSEEGSDLNNIENMIITFLCILELSRLKKLAVFQNEEGGPIYIEILQSLKDLNVDLIQETAGGAELAAAKDNLDGADELVLRPLGLSNLAESAVPKELIDDQGELKGLIQ